MPDEVCGAMLILVTGRRERVFVCARDPHDRGRHKTYTPDITEWETRGEDQPVTRAASR